MPVDQQTRRLRFLFTASAEVASENSPNASVAELSLNGCHLDISAPFAARTPVFVKIFTPTQYFEAKATVIYVNPSMGMGVVFREGKPGFLAVLKEWLLAAMQNQKKPAE
jgi:hypothetical protein